jgi:asparagine synthase (glutamine-hydrolysing)
MCGIWALINGLGLTTEQLKCFQQLKPRGPDHCTLHIYQHYAIGHHWLSLSDYTTKGEQPYYYHHPDYNYSIMCNGEIYNYKYLKEKYNLITDTESDCSIVFPLFLALQQDFEELNRLLIGEYAIFIAKEDRKSGVVEYFLSVDALSVIPAFYFSTQEQFGCASLRVGLSYCEGEVKRLDQGSYIHGRYDPGKNTNELIAAEKYSRLPPVVFKEESVEVYEKIVSTLRTAVEDRVSYHRPLGCLLSGGLDSGLVASIAAELLREKGKKLLTFCIGFKDSRDLMAARKLANHIASEHT